MLLLAPCGRSAAINRPETHQQLRGNQAFIYASGLEPTREAWKDQANKALLVKILQSRLGSPIRTTKDW